MFGRVAKEVVPALSIGETEGQPVGGVGAAYIVERSTAPLAASYCCTAAL